MSETKPQEKPLTAYQQAQAEHACAHPNPRLTVRTHSNQTQHLYEQCGTCGATLGGAVKKAAFTPEQIQAMPRFDADLSDLHFEAIRNRQAEIITLKDAESAAEYAAGAEERRRVYREEYCRSPHWRATRARVLKRDKGICQGCMESPAYDVHHTTYRHRGRELLFELVSLCRACHDQLHATMGEPEYS